MLARGRFREDLYFRLRVFPIAIPPLRDRLADIPGLVHHFMEKKARELGMAHIPTVAPGAIERLMNYHWPGNVRELQNVVERALILSKETQLTFEGFKDPAERNTQKTDTHDRMDNDSLGLDSVIIRHITRVLDMSGGEVGGENGAARLLKINSSTLRKKMIKLGIPFGRKVKKG